MNLRDVYHNKWVRAGFWSILYLLWVIWLGNYWWLLGLAVIFDLFVTHKVKWLSGRKSTRKGKSTTCGLIGLMHNLCRHRGHFHHMFLFPGLQDPFIVDGEAPCTAGDHLFVSKMTYGPKVPQTPLTIPFTHNVIFGKESYSTLIQNDYRRLKGFASPQRRYRVFNFPNGDTVLPLSRRGLLQLGKECRQGIHHQECGSAEGTSRLTRKTIMSRDAWQLPETLLKVREGRVFVNGKMEESYPGLQYACTVVTNGQRINPMILSKAGLDPETLYFDESLPGYRSLCLTTSAYEEIRNCPAVVSAEIEMDVYPPDYPDSYLSIFPFEEDYRWTRDFFGPLWIPKKGVTVELTPENIPLYRRIISTYEGHQLREEQDGRIFIDGQQTSVTLSHRTIIS